jgi:lysozyme family protein
MNFDQAFHLLLGHEGGFVDHPNDPGGATRWGVTERVARQNGYTGPMRELPVEVAKDIYRRQYWAAIRADELPCLLRYPVFDGAVNSGVGQSIRWLQRALGVADDGRIGPITIGAAQRAEPGDVLRRMLAQRLRFMADLSTWQSFGRGWARRISDLLMRTT